MLQPHPALRRTAFPSLVAFVLLLAPAPAAPQEAATGELRPMTFLDVQHLRSAGSLTPSPDRRWLLHTVSEPDWKGARSQTDLHLVSLTEGVASSRRLTFTAERNEGSPSWLTDSRRFLFLSNRDAPPSAQNRNQLYLMATDGGEAQRVTDASDGVSNYALSPDGEWVVFRSGASGREQLHRVPTAGLGTAEAEAVTEHPTGVGSWEWSVDGAHLWFTALDTIDTLERERRERGFTVNIRNQEAPLSGLWRVPVTGGEAERMAGGDGGYSVGPFTLSPDGRWVGFSGGSPARYQRNITQAGLYADLYLLETATGHIERLTDTFEASPGGLSFSPDSRWVAFSAPLELQRYTMGNRHLYLREVADRGGELRILGRDFDGHIGVSFWSEDGGTIFFNEGIRATRQLLAMEVSTGAVRQVTDEPAVLGVSRDDVTGVLLITWQDPTTPTQHFTAPSLDAVGDRSRWVQLTDPNPQVRGFALGRQEEVTWVSSDGVEVGGVLTWPVGYEPGTRYPLIVAIHGGPAAADLLGFNGGYGSQVYAGAGYAVLKPNYRGSTNYGEAFRTGIVGNYFPPGYEDIMTGVDHLIAEGIVDGERMGALGWSAGGHWSNWILISTDRFRAISSGAGTSNWISMYAQSDVQRNRQYYLGDELPYMDFESYWDQSPLKYITNARTPTMIHVVEGDPRVPSPQSVELHRALVDLGVPTELFLYPGTSHGIPDPRNRLLKSMSEMQWMDYWVRGIGDGFRWEPLLETVPGR